MNHDRPPFSESATRVVFGTFGFVFAGIGVSLIAWLWLQPSEGFGSPPLIFRIVGSFISIAFVAMGSTFALGALAPLFGFKAPALRPTTPPFPDEPSPPPATSPAGYTCPHCGATLDAKSDVSPLGDVKCGYCRQWFNVHRK